MGENILTQGTSLTLSINGQVTRSYLTMYFWLKKETKVSLTKNQHKFKKSMKKVDYG